MENLHTALRLRREVRLCHRDVLLPIRSWQQFFFAAASQILSRCRKTQSLVAWHVCDSWQLSPAQVLFVGDSRDDMKCADQARCQFALLGSELSVQQEIKAMTGERRRRMHNQLSRPGATIVEPRKGGIATCSLTWTYYYY